MLVPVPIQVNVLTHSSLVNIKTWQRTAIKEKHKMFMGEDLCELYGVLEKTNKDSEQLEVKKINDF